MMNFISGLRKGVEHESVRWCESARYRGVRFAIRRVSLGQRIELTRRARELSIRHEFLKAGETSDQLEAALGDLLVQRMYLEWGLVEIEGLTIDGRPAMVEDLADKAPENLTAEIVDCLRSELSLSDEQIKNS